MEKIYLGEAVYASFDGYQVILSIGHDDIEEPSAPIFLSLSMIETLTMFKNRVFKQAICDHDFTSNYHERCYKCGYIKSPIDEMGTKS